MIHFKPFNGWFNNNLPLYYTQDITLLETVQHLICDYNEKLKIIEDSYNSLESTVYETFAKWERLFDEFTTKIENEWAEYKRNMRTEWENYKENLNNEWAEYKQNMRTEWNNYKNEMNKAFNQLRADMEAYKTEITNSFNELKADFEALEDNVEAFKSDMTSKFTQLRSDWETYKTNLNSEWAQFKEDTTNDLTEYKNNLTGEWTTYKNEMNSNYTEFTQNITAKITAIEGEWDSFETAQNNKYNEFTAGITEQINTIKSEWAAKQKEIDSTISNIKNEWTTFEGDITTQWNNYKTEVNNTIQEFETEWAGWQETITNITNDNTQIKQDIETLKTTVEDLQEQINSIQPSENGIAYIVADENAEIDANAYQGQKSILQFNETNTLKNFPSGIGVNGVENGYLINLNTNQILIDLTNEGRNPSPYYFRERDTWEKRNSPKYNRNDVSMTTSVVHDVNLVNGVTYFTKFSSLPTEINDALTQELLAIKPDTTGITGAGNPAHGYVISNADVSYPIVMMIVYARVYHDGGATNVNALFLRNNNESDKWIWIPSANAIPLSQWFTDYKNQIQQKFGQLSLSIETVKNDMAVISGGVATFTPGGRARVLVGSQDHVDSIKTSKAVGRLSKGELNTNITMTGGIQIFPEYGSFNGDYNKLYVTAEAFPTDPDIGNAMTFAGSCQPDTSGQFTFTAKVNGASPLKCDYIIVFTLYDLN